MTKHLFLVLIDQVYLLGMLLIFLQLGWLQTVLFSILLLIIQALIIVIYKASEKMEELLFGATVVFFEAICVIKIINGTVDRYSVYSVMTASVIVYLQFLYWTKRNTKKKKIKDAAK